MPHIQRFGAVIVVVIVTAAADETDAAGSRVPDAVAVAAAWLAVADELTGRWPPSAHSVVSCYQAAHDSEHSEYLQQMDPFIKAVGGDGDIRQLGQDCPTCRPFFAASVRDQRPVNNSN